MGLTWRDAVSSCAIVVIVITYAVYLGGTSLLLISSAWATSAVVLVLGIGCAVVASGDLYTRPQPRLGEVFRGIATGLGTIAVILIGSSYKTMALAAGGSAVSEMMGARLVSSNTINPDERKLLNVVEEMSIASGIPMPQVYVMDS